MKNLLLYILFPLFALACENDPVENPDSGNSALETMHLRDGITRISDDSLAFVLFAPGKNSVHLVGDFNSWKMSAPYKLHKDGDRFWLKIGDLDVNKEYVLQYLVDENIRIADPYAGKIIERNNNNAEPAMVVSTKQNNYDWKITNYTVSDPAKLVIYEILIRDFTEKRTIKGVQEKLPYLKALGINAIELMPFNEFEGSDGWGYNPSFYFAPESAYGTASDYKEFIDACHENGMAVIMDMVLNHSYGQSPLVKLYQKDGTITADNPWYNVKSPNTAYSWGYDFNHESPYTQAFVDSVNAYWLGEYKIDGYRFDFTKGFTNKSGDGQAFDQSRINILKRMTSEIWKRKHDAIVIFEHLADNSEEKVLADHGILLWGNLNYNMNEATMGWGAEPNNGTLKGDISWASYKQRGWAKPHLVAYMESHDEERIMFKNTAYGKAEGTYNVKSLPTALDRTAAAAVILLAIPGPKMIWQFGELGYDFELNNDRLGRKPIRWDYYETPERKALHDVFTMMIDYHKNNPAFATSDYDTDLTGNFKTVTLRDASETVVVMANFDVVPQTKGDVTLQPGEYRIDFK